MRVSLKCQNYCIETIYIIELVDLVSEAYINNT